MLYIDYYEAKRKSHFKILISRGDGCALVKDLNESVRYFVINRRNNF